MSSAARSQKPWPRFSLATFLFVSICIGGLIAGHQSGYRNGYNAGAAQRYNETQSSETYSTAAFVWPDLPAEERTQSVDQLKDLIRSTIATDIWSDGSGNEIRDFPTNHSLVITAPGSVHSELKNLFAQLERLANRGGGNELLPAMQSLAAQGKSQESPLSITVPKNSQMAQVWLEKYYGLTIESINEHWGPPDFRGACTDATFPNWSIDQQIATWPRGNGLAYLALRYLDDGQLHVVIGWREDS